MIRFLQRVRRAISATPLFRLLYVPAAIAARRPQRDAKIDLLIVLPEGGRGWILERVGREIASRFEGTSAFHESVFRIPPARAYFFTHHSLLPTALALNPSVARGRILVFYTHDKPLPFSRRELLHALRFSTKVLAMSSRSAEQLRREGIAQATHLVGGADPDLFPPHTRSGNGSVGFVSAFYERKGPERILAIAKALPHRSVLLVGRGWRAWNRFAELEALPNFRYVEPAYEDYPRHYAEMDVFVSPSLHEGGPIPLLEAMMSNVVPVASDTGFARDVIEHGRNGFLFDPHAPVEEVVALIEQAFQLDTDVRATAQHLSWDYYARRVLELLR